MKNPFILASALLASGQALAANPTLPEACQKLAAQSAQIVGQSVEADDNTSTDITLGSDLRGLPVSKVTFLGNCDEDTHHKLKDTWCRVAGGSPDVYKVSVSEKQDSWTGPKASVIVTFNRGYCRIDEVIADR